MNLKTIYQLLAIISITFLSVACAKESPTQVEDEQPITVQFDLAVPFITSSDELLTKTSSTENYIYTIVIQEYNKITSEYESYAYGVFDDIFKANIPMYKSKKYNIEVGVINNFFSSGNMFASVAGLIWDPTNAFRMNASIGMNEWNDWNVWGYTYYGKLSDYTPTDAGVCSVDMKSETSGLKMVVSGLNVGKVRFSFDSSSYQSITMALNEITELSSFLSFCWLGTEKNNWNRMCKIEYIDENNSATTLTTESFTFIKGYRKVININLQDSTNKPIDSGFNVSFTEPKLTDEDPVNFDFTL
jgi:hypothetical protein